jgi:hypothetical protein
VALGDLESVSKGPNSKKVRKENWRRTAGVVTPDGAWGRNEEKWKLLFTEKKKKKKNLFFSDFSWSEFNTFVHFCWRLFFLFYTILCWSQVCFTARQSTTKTMARRIRWLSNLWGEKPEKFRCVITRLSTRVPVNSANRPPGLAAAHAVHSGRQFTANI